MYAALTRKVYLGLIGTMLLAAVGSGVGLLFALHTEGVYRDLLTRTLEQASGEDDGIPATGPQVRTSDIEQAMAGERAERQRVILLVSLCLALTAALLGSVAWLLLRKVLRPLRQMTQGMREYVGPGHVPQRAEDGISPGDLFAGGEPLQVLGSCLEAMKSDMTAARSTLAESTRRLADSEKLAAMGRLAAGVAHEIRSPLTSLKLRLFSMQKNLRGDTRCEHDVRVISEEITRLDGIIRNFLEFARPPDLQIRPCSLPLLLDKTLELLRYKLGASKIYVVREEDPCVPSVLADPQQLGQVLINLINNAMDAQPEGGLVRVQVGCEPAAGDQEMVVIRVADTGPGIPADVAERIFDPFFSTKADGAGLGLWIAKRIVTEHRGALELEAAGPRGTVLAIRIPAAQRAEHEQDPDRGRRPERAHRV